MKLPATNIKYHTTIGLALQLKKPVANKSLQGEKVKKEKNMRTEIELFNRKQCLLTNNLFGTSKINEITNLPIHESKVLHKCQSLLKPPF